MGGLDFKMCGLGLSPNEYYKTYFAYLNLESINSKRRSQNSKEILSNSREMEPTPEPPGPWPRGPCPAMRLYNPNCTFFCTDFGP